MSWVASDLSALEDAIAVAAIRGFASVTFSGRTSQRYSISELLALRVQMKAAVNASAGKVKCTFAEFSKG